MATRKGPTRLIPGNPIGSVLKSTARKARSTSRRGGLSRPGPQGEPGPPGAPGFSGPAGVVAASVAELVTDATGVAVWSYSALRTPPHIVATAVAGGPVLLTVANISETSATITAYGLGGLRVPSQVVHVVAYARAGTVLRPGNDNGSQDPPPAI